MAATCTACTTGTAVAVRPTTGRVAAAALAAGLALFANAPDVAWGWATVHDAGAYSMSRFLAGGLALQLVVGGAVAVVVARVGLRPLRAAAWAAAAAAVASAGGTLWLANWGWFSPAYAIATTLDTVTGWALAGALAAVVLADRSTGRRARRRRGERAVNAD